MRQNPEVVRFDRGWGIRFVRRSWTVLCWVQDLYSRKMKATITRPLVLFDSKEEAEQEARTVVIPYLLKEKDVTEEEIVGW